MTEIHPEPVISRSSNISQALEAHTQAMTLSRKAEEDFINALAELVNLSGLIASNPLTQAGIKDRARQLTEKLLEEHQAITALRQRA